MEGERGRHPLVYSNSYSRKSIVLYVPVGPVLICSQEKRMTTSYTSSPYSFYFLYLLNKKNMYSFLGVFCAVYSRESIMFYVPALLCRLETVVQYSTTRNASYFKVLETVLLSRQNLDIYFST